MAQLASSFIQACCKGFNDRHLRSAISFEVERGFRNTFGRTMRFSNFLHLKLQRWCSRSSHGSAKKLLEEVSRYDTASLSERANFLNKISVLMGYGSTQDLIEQERIQSESGADAKGMVEEFDFSTICGRFPSIKLGDSSLVELYDEVQHTEVEASYLPSERTSEYLAASRGKWSEPIPHRIRYGTTTDEKLAEIAIVGALDSLVCPLSDTNSHPITEDNSSVIFSVQEVDSNGLKEKLDAEGTNEKSSETMLLTESGLAVFPSIKLGDESLVELYEEVQHTEVNASYLPSERTSEYLAASGGNWSELIPHRIRCGTSTDEKLAETASVEALDSLVCPLSDTNSHPIKEDNSSVIFSVQEVDSNGLKDKLDVEGTNEKSSETMLLTESCLDKTIRSIDGLSSKQYCQLENNGFYTVRKLLQHFPRTYADLRNAQEAIDDGCYVMFTGTIKSSKGIRATSSLSFLEVIVACEFLKNEQTSEISNEDNGTEEKKMVYLHLKKFFCGRRFTNQPFLKSIQSKYKEGDLVYASGKVRKMRMQDHYEMKEYSIDMLQGEEELDAHVDRRPYPIYPCKAGLKSSFFAEIIKRALKMLNVNMDPMPDDILKEFNLLNLYDAYVGMHNPKSLNEADLARRRLIFDDFFYLQLGRLFQMLDALGTRMEKEELLDKYKNHELNSIRIEEWSNLTKRFLDALPYTLTPSQQNAVSEIIWDLKRPVPMNRLLQGDVGCGKTVVAFMICMEVIGSGFQAAFMVPTELLAIQHYEHLLALLDDIGGDVCKPSIALLTGSTSSRESRTILKGLQTGEIAMVIGTHSLIAEKIEFSALRIAVVDEQHRFGVIQRGRFTSKLYSASSSLRMSGKDSNWSAEDKSYMAPHILAMSATPIPRTLALALYGDMSLTQITDLPPGRMPIETFVLEGDAKGFKKVFQMMRDELMEGGKIYLVYPVIEESEQLPQLHAAAADVQSISKKFDGYPCGLLHGRMKSDEKDDTLKKFRSGEFRILLATQVIEIGVDVPDASMMVVMNAERFGIAQLHQLRGRVGRGARKSKCVFLSSTSGALGRLKVLEKSSNGFYLANMDLLIRGPGNLLGKKQSGHLPEFPIARLEIDGNILQEAHVAALKVLGTSNDLEVFPKLKAELSMRQPLCILGD